MEISKKLREARKQLHLSQAQVAAAIGLSTSVICEWEQGERTPNLAQLNTLASLYHKSISYFLEEREPATPTVLWRDRPPEQKVGEWESLFHQLVQQYKNLEIWTKAEPTGSIADLFQAKWLRNFDEIGDMAAEVGKRAGLGNIPAEALLRVLVETYGIKVFHLPMGSEGSSASFFSKDLGGAVLLNSESVRWRRNYDLAHELFHLVTWEIMPDQISHKDAIEKFAQSFAGALLLPIEPFEKAIHKECNDQGRISLEALEYVARQFDVSYEALVWRMRVLFNLSQETATELIPKLQQHGRMIGRRDDTAKSPTYPTRYVALVRMALRAGEISAKRYLQYLELMSPPPSQAEVDELLQANDAALTQVLPSVA